MTLADLITEVKRIVHDPSWDDAAITSYLDRGYNAIAGQLLLPWLVSQDTVTTDATVSVDVPSDYHRNLFMATYVGSDDEPVELKVLTGLKALTDYSGTISTTTDSVASYVCVSGDKLIYQAVPTEATDIELSYYGKPTELSSLADNWNNDSFDDALILFASWKIWNVIESGTEGGKPETMAQYQDFLRAFEEVHLFCVRYGENYVTQPASANKTW